ncbi:MAG: TetR/AcrR family transcriptional regulator [Williamsia sp.]|nr:TetR/AcrR family transcriptional regulator [Williamsia sp.]
MNEYLFTYICGVKVKDQSKIEHIYDATLKLVKTKGLAGITMNEIAASAGLATGTLYIYFDSKEDLINALFSTCKQASEQICFQGYNEGEPFKNSFRTIWHNLLNYRIDNFKEAVFMDQCCHSPFLTETNKELTSNILHPLFKLFEQGKQEGVIKALDNFLLITFITGSIHEVVKYAHSHGKKLTGPVIEDIFEMCWNGIKA